MSERRRAELNRTEAAVTLGVTPDFLVEHVIPALTGIGTGPDASLPLLELHRWLAAAVAADRVLTVEETAARVQVSPRTVLRAIRAGQLTASQLHQGRGGWRIYESSIDRWMQSRALPGPAARENVPPRLIDPDRRRRRSASNAGTGHGRLAP